MSLTVDDVDSVSEGSVRMVDTGAIVASLDGLSSSVIIWFTRVAWPNPIVGKRGQGGRKEEGGPKIHQLRYLIFDYLVGWVFGCLGGVGYSACIAQGCCAG